MTDRLQNFGYVTLTFALDCPPAPAGSVVRAHEFHYSRLEGLAEDAAVFHAEKADGRAWPGGLRKGNVYAAYPHLYFYGCPEFCDAFIAACLDYQRGRKGRS
jgi:cobyrinic acid a,c-diamide synthase